MAASQSSVQAALAKLRRDLRGLCRGAQLVLPGLVAPYAYELRATEVARRDRQPLAGCRRVLSAELAQILHPIPFQQRPILVIDDTPALGREERHLHLARNRGVLVDRLYQRLLPVFRPRAINVFGLEAQVRVSLRIEPFVSVFRELVELTVILLDHPDVGIEQVEVAQVMLEIAFRAVLSEREQ